MSDLPTTDTAAVDTLPVWAAAGRYREFKGLNIFTRSAGVGPVLLLIHGFPTASWDWAKLWPTLSSRYRLITLDLAGFGYSAKPTDLDYTMALHADIIEELLAAEGVKEYRILAHDYGVTVAQELLARQLDGTARQKLLKICFLNGGLFPEAHRPLLMQKLLLSPLGPLVAWLTNFEKFSAAMQKVCGGRLSEEELQGFWSLLNHNQGRRIFPKLIRYIEERKRHRERWVGALIKSRLPLRFVNGMDDPVSGAHMLALYKELVPGADTVALDGVGHYPQVEAPERVLKAVVDFLA